MFGDDSQYPKIGLGELTLFTVSWICCEAQILGKVFCPPLHFVSVHAKKLGHF